jgi:hypothetical protein
MANYAELVCRLKKFIFETVIRRSMLDFAKFLNISYFIKSCDHYFIKDLFIVVVQKKVFENFLNN